ncbi:MAG: hypothetical protein JO128_22710 [Alphaproteobacteria bacterium]|nr:hypothetical protein [Alphaproteobacteria bacterium]
MPGTFRYPFGDPETTGYFGGYRQPQSSAAGAVAAAAGYSLEEALQGAGLYNKLRPGAFLSTVLGKAPEYETRYGLKQDAVHNIPQGWQDVTDGKWNR